MQNLFLKKAELTKMDADSERGFCDLQLVSMLNFTVFVKLKQFYIELKMFTLAHFELIVIQSDRGIDVEAPDHIRFALLDVAE